MPKLFCVICLLCCLCASSLSAESPVKAAKTEIKVGQAAPDLWGHNAGGEVYDYRKSFQGKTILMVFWSLQDPEHRRLEQQLRAIRKEYLPEQKLVMVSQCVDPHFDEWRNYCARQPDLDGNPFYDDARWIQQTQGGFDQSKINSAKEFGVTKTPALFLIGADRKFLAVHIPPEKLSKALAQKIPLAGKPQ